MLLRLFWNLIKRKKVKKIYKQFILVYILVYSFIFLSYFLNALTYNSLSSTFPAGVINLINSIAAIFAFQRGFHRSNNVFLLFIFGGMLIRLFIILILVFLTIKYLNIDKLGFIFTLFIIYFINLILEINYFRVRIAEKKS
jgi:hypothetical protein